MPLTPKGSELLDKFKQEYGPTKGREVFYAAKNKGTITGVEEKSDGDGKSKSSGKSGSKHKGS